jgi:hypothetical protein
MSTTTITRKQLYDRVWSEPMTRLARSFGLSDVGMAKICTRHKIPRPPRGYWAKKQFGQKPQQIPLPHPENDCEIRLRDPDDNGVAAPEIWDRIQTVVKEGKSKESRIEVAETLRGAHDLVSRGNQELQAARTNEVGLIITPEKSPLSISASKSCLRRSLLIMDALLKALEQRGYAVEAGPTVIILDVALKFGIYEHEDVKREEPDEQELDGRYVFGHSRFKHKSVASGRLMLRIHDTEQYWRHGCRKSWSDGEKQRLEDCLNKVIGGLMTIAARVKERQAELERMAQKEREEKRRREEAARVRAEKREQYQAERARVDLLIAQAKNWRRSQDLRNYVKAATQEYLAKFATIEPDGQFAAWAEWAMQQADRLDPLAASPPSILDTDPKELEEPKYGYLGSWQG